MILGGQGGFVTFLVKIRNDFDVYMSPVSESFVNFLHGNSTNA